MDENEIIAPPQTLADARAQLSSEEAEITNQLISQPTDRGLKDLTALFNAVQVKKNALRVQKLNDLFDRVTDSISERFDKRVDEFSNRDLLDYLSVTQTSIEKAQKGLNSVSDVPPIVFNQQNQQINIKVEDTLPRESRERVMDAITAILQNNIITTDDKVSTTFYAEEIPAEDNEVNKTDSGDIC